MKEKEIWKRLIYQGEDYGDFYEVSNYGKIRNSKTHRIRSENLLQTGYCFVSGSLGCREKKITFRVHKAVAESFIDNPNNLPVVNHKDGDKLNNCVDNLEWCTYSQNSQHAYDNNLINVQRGENRHTSKLTQDAVDYIRKHYIPRDRNFGTRALGRKFNVDHTTIMSALNNETWV